jgi:hypothetical protein
MGNSWMRARRFASLAGRKQGRKVFFFEKKKQKTFIHLAAAAESCG